MLEQLATEQQNPKTERVDELGTLEIVTLMNELDHEVPAAIKKELDSISRAADKVVKHFEQGGRLFYAGSGTSGRLGIADAAECPPTFGVPSSLIQGIMAGGINAFIKAAESVEDNEEAAVADFKSVNLNERDVIIAISASGRTPYCIGALKYAREIGAGRIAVSCNKAAKMSEWAEVPIEVYTGPELIMGSTRLKAGTAQKIILNMISSTAMIKMGKVYRNLMVDMKATNSKLKDRSIRIFLEATNTTDPGHASGILKQADGNIKTAIVMELAGVGRFKAEAALAAQKGFVKPTLQYLIKQAD